jgi:hypothetical protein
MIAWFGGLFWYVFLPLVRTNRQRKAREFEAMYRAFKLAALRTYYPQFRELTLDELQLRYDIDSWYNAIGYDGIVSSVESNQRFVSTEIF